MKLGIVLPPFYPSALLEMTLDAAHAVGADSAWIPDHLLGIFHPDLYPETGFAQMAPDPDGLFDPFCLCASAGRLTDLPLGIAVTDGIRRAAPDVARAALSLQHLCKGGINLGVGSGEAENLTPFGYPFDRPVAALERFLTELRQLLDAGRMPEGVGRLGLPLESEAGPPRIWVAAHQPRMLRLTGQYADGWLPVEPGTPEGYRTAKATIARHAAAAGRPEPESGLFIFLVLGESRERIRELYEAEPLSKLFALWMAPAPVLAEHGLEIPGYDGRAYIDIIPHELDPEALRKLAPHIPFELLEKYLFLGNPAEVAERLRPYADAGLGHPVVMNITGLAGGLEEAMAHGPALGELVAMLKAMEPARKVSAGD